MPIYEYHCQPCDHDFETLVRSSGDVPRCPKCGEIDRLAKQFSVPASAQTGGKGASLPVCDAGPSFGCGGPGPCGSGMCAMD